MKTAAASTRTLGLYYRAAAYEETLQVHRNQPKGRPQALMGREVASNGFLQALLQKGNWSTLEAIVEDTRDRSSLQAICRQHLDQSATPKRVKCTPINELSRWFRGEKNTGSNQKVAGNPNKSKRPSSSLPATSVLHFASPPDPRFAWARQRYAPHSVALSGVTHTLCSPRGLDTIWQLLTAPVHPYDRLISTSTAVTRMLRRTTEVMSEYLSGRDAGTNKFEMTIEQLPLGVDTQQHAPATDAQRAAARAKLGITSGPGRKKLKDLVLLFVGRLSHHAKANPFPTLMAAQRTAQANEQRKVHLVLAGWFSNESIQSRFIASAKRFAPSVELHLIDGLDPWWRDHVWDAADIFISLADSIQETFGLTNLEAMSRGIPVVATDWNGYRDTIIDGETGILVPTSMLRHCNDDAAARVFTGEISYDQFLGEIGQTVAVSVQHSINVVKQLADDDDLRSCIGKAGRERAESRFAWSRVIESYETMWQHQRDEKALFQQASLRISVSNAKSADPDNARHQQPTRAEPAAAFDHANDSDRPDQFDVSGDGFSNQHPVALSPARFPPIDVSFDGYPTKWLDDRSEVSAIRQASELLTQLLSDDLSQHSGGARVNSHTQLHRLTSSFKDSWKTISAAIDEFERDSQESSDAQTRQAVRSSIAWLIKYGVLQYRSEQLEDAGSRMITKTVLNAPVLSFVTTCKGRLEDLQNTLPRLVEQPGCEVVVVDYDCPQQCGRWVENKFPSVMVVSVPNKSVFDRSDAKNRGVAAATAPWICLIDADVELEPEFCSTVAPSLQPGSFYRSSHPGEGTGGTFIVRREDFDRVGGHDPVFQGWGEEDDDLIDALKFIGLQTRRYSADLIRHRDHEDVARTLFHQDDDRRHSHMINRLYRCGKWDLARLSGVVAPIERRQAIYNAVAKEVRKLMRKGVPGTIRIDTGTMRWTPVASKSQRILEYTITPSGTQNAGDYEPSHQQKELPK